jgi:hypothetical protein
MLLSIKKLLEYKIEAIDGHIGHADSFLFDDQTWIIRYLVVDTGGWLSGRKVLLAPSALGKPVTDQRVFPIELTRRQIEDSPDIDTDKPVSRQHETALHEYYNWTPYWGGGVAMPYAPFMQTPEERETQKQAASVGVAEADQHLRSTKEVIGYKIHAKDGKIGHLDDLIVEEYEWKIRLMIVDTGGWIAGRKVLIPPAWIKEIRWEESEAYVDVTKEEVQKSPEFNPESPVNREYETRLYDYYGRPKYWG